MRLRYLIVLTAAGRRIDNNHVAIESAFVEHLRTLRSELGERFGEIVVAMAEMTAADYEHWQSGMTVIDEVAESIRFVPLFTWHASKLQFMKEAPAALRALTREVKAADIVHSHASYDLWRPVEAWAIALAVAMKKPVMSITDMDNRRDADMNFQLSRWDRRTYSICKYVYDPLRDLQQRAIVKACDLVLFKELQQVEDYGRGAEHVRLFLDPNFLPEHIAPDDVIARKVRALQDPDEPLRLLYFGRLVSYKGVDKMIEAVASAHERGADVELSIMGTGPDEETLRALVSERGLDDIVEWITPRAYGPAFFDVLRERDVLLACPLSADTPRSTWDAFASGMPILAFDTPFYAGVGKYTGAVETVQWPSAQALADKIVELASDKSVLIPLVRKAVAAAHANTGAEWMKKRVQWAKELLGITDAVQTPATPEVQTPAEQWNAAAS
jgi:glycosyltransferase involved in cell wall biosynthesis